MRTFLVCTLRVTISPWNSLPDFLKEPMLAMSLLLAVSSPRPSRPRWRSVSRRRSTTHPPGPKRQWRTATGRLSCLARNAGPAGRGRKSPRRRCGLGDRGAAGLRPDRAKERTRGPCSDSILKRRHDELGAGEARGRKDQKRRRKPRRRKGTDLFPVKPLSPRHTL